MFYISDINGVLSPYDPNRFRIEREARLLAQAQDAELQAETTGTAEALAMNPTQTSASQAASSNQSVASESTSSPAQIADAAATGMAGASMLHRQGSVQRRGEVPTDQEQKEHDRTAQLLQQMIRPAARLSKKIKEKEAATGVNPYKKIDEPIPERSKAISVDKIMSDQVITITKDQTIAEAGRIFEEHRFRHIPVLSSPDGKLIGVFSDRNYLAARDLSLPVESCMATTVLTARPETEIRRVAEVMFEERIGAMPVLQDDGSLVGIVTRSDILCALVHHAPLEIWV